MSGFGKTRVTSMMMKKIQDVYQRKNQCLKCGQDRTWKQKHPIIQKLKFTTTPPEICLHCYINCDCHGTCKHCQVVKLLLMCL